MAAKAKEKSRTTPGPRSGPESWGLSSPVVPPRCSLVKEAAALPVAQICYSLWLKTQKPSSFSWCSTFAHERHCKWPGGEYIWTPQNKNLEKKTLKYVTCAPSYHLLQAAARMSIWSQLYGQSGYRLWALDCSPWSIEFSTSCHGPLHRDQHRFSI